MGIKLEMPSLSPTMEEGTIAKWHVKVGDKIEEGTVLCSVETDKTTVDYESLDEGYLRAIHVESGSAKVNALIGYITDEADEEFEADYQEAIEASKKAEEEAAPAPAAEAPAAPAPAAPAPVAAPAAPTFTAPVAPAPVAAAPVSNANVKASPVARKMAEEKGIDLSTVKGSGPGGRIIKGDIENYVPSAAPAAAGKPGKPDISKQPAVIGSMAPVPPTVDEPLGQVMKVIGQRLAQSQTDAVEFFVAMKIQVDALNALRKQLNNTPGYKISLNDLVVKAVAMNLRRFPVVNSSFYGDFIRKNSNIDISIAVSTPDGGLITPIVTNADAKPLGIISAEVKSLVKKAATGTLAPEEFQGGTFTVSNMGMFGVSSFTSIINPPQSAILAVAGVEEELYFKEDGEVGSKKMMTVNLTADHRVINGALAAQFVNGLKEIIENPASLML
jgi:pyruvate dehydrogenase E2 component (dihydrolipoamide acetyltransferase)